jgi:hypothetical protein
MVKKANNRRMGLPLAVARFLLFQHPLLLLAGVWVSLLLVANVAAKGLINPGGELDRAEVAPIAATTFEAPIHTTEPTPIVSSAAIAMGEVTASNGGKPPWLYGAIVLGIVGGSVLAYFRRQQTQLSGRSVLPAVSTRKKSNPTSPISRRRQRQQSKRSQVMPEVGQKQRSSVATAMAPNGDRELRTPRTERKSRTPVTSRRKAPTPLNSLAASTPVAKVNASENLRREPALSTPVVTVIPPKSHRRSLGEDNLLDSMDMRQRQPLSALLRDR